MSAGADLSGEFLSVPPESISSRLQGAIDEADRGDLYERPDVSVSGQTDEAQHEILQATRYRWMDGNIVRFSSDDFDLVAEGQGRAVMRDFPTAHLVCNELTEIEPVQSD
jgi:hypothetical protein